jgi:hypothetical protein
MSDNAMRDGPTHIRFRLLLIVVCGSLLAVASGPVAIQLRRSVHAQELAIAHTLADRTQMLVGLWVSVQEYRQAVEQFVLGDTGNHRPATRRLLG